MAKIAIVTPFPPHGIGGGETFVKALFNEASKENDVHIITIGKAANCWQGTPILKSFGLLWKLLIELFKRENSKYDIYHAQGIIAALACVLYQFFTFKKKKLLITILALYDFKINPWWCVCKLILNRADKIFVEGQTGRQDLLDCGVEEDKIVEFYHWVDLEKFKPIAKSHDGDISILFIGRPIRIKGKHIIEQTERILFYAKQLKFKYVENLSHEELINYYQEADVLVVPSLYSEGFPRVIFEAAACGCLIIASNKGSLPELVSPFGESISPTPEEFARCLKQINYEYIKKWSAFTRKYAERFFSPKNAEVFLKEYR